MSNEYETYEKDDEEFIYLPFDRIVRQTEAAILFDMGEGHGQYIPIRHIDMDEFDSENTDEKSVPVKVWFARNNGLI